RLFLICSDFLFRVPLFRVFVISLLRTAAFCYKPPVGSEIARGGRRNRPASLSADIRIEMSYGRYPDAYARVRFTPPPRTPLAAFPSIGWGQHCASPSISAPA